VIAATTKGTNTISIVSIREHLSKYPKLEMMVEGDLKSTFQK
jgi:hypothetical protein